MKKNTTNFWVDIIIFIDLMAVIFTGILIHRFPYELKGGTILGFPRFEWGDLHWVLALFLIFLILLHLVFHRTWAKVSFKKYLKIEPKVLAITVIAITIFCGIVAPLYLTKDFPHRKVLRDTYRASYSLTGRYPASPPCEGGVKGDNIKRNYLTEKPPRVRAGSFKFEKDEVTQEKQGRD